MQDDKFIGETQMDLDHLPVELRRVFEDAGLVAESKSNERIKVAMLGLQHAVEADLKAMRERDNHAPRLFLLGRRKTIGFGHVGNKNKR